MQEKQYTEHLVRAPWACSRSCKLVLGVFGSRGEKRYWLGFCLGERHYPSYLLVKLSVLGKTLVDRENRGLILKTIDRDNIGYGFERGRESYSWFHILSFTNKHSAVQVASQCKQMASVQNNQLYCKIKTKIVIKI